MAGGLNKDSIALAAVALCRMRRRSRRRKEDEDEWRGPDGQRNERGPRSEIVRPCESRNARDLENILCFSRP